MSAIFVGHFTRSDMLAMKEALAVLVIMRIQQSVEQSTNILPTKYERVSVETSSFSSIKTTNLGAQGYGWSIFTI